MSQKALLPRMILHAIAILVLLSLFTSPVNSAFRGSPESDRVLEAGKWAIRFLLVSLAMSPLNTYFRWRSAIPLRKPAGLWAFAFAAVHVVFAIFDNLAISNHILLFPLAQFLILGLIGFGILAAMAATSTRLAQRQLGKHWKRLHRLVYIAGVVVILHGLLAQTKRVLLSEPSAAPELQLYLVLVIFLLVVRVPVVKNTIQQIEHLVVRGNAQSTHMG